MVRARSLPTTHTHSRKYWRIMHAYLSLLSPTCSRDITTKTQPVLIGITSHIVHHRCRHQHHHHHMWACLCATNATCFVSISISLRPYARRGCARTYVPCANKTRPTQYIVHSTWHSGLSIPSGCARVRARGRLHDMNYKSPVRRSRLHVREHVREPLAHPRHNLCTNGNAMRCVPIVCVYHFRRPSESDHVYWSCSRYAHAVSFLCA